MEEVQLEYYKMGGSLVSRDSAFAAKNGYLLCLKWLHENKCPFDSHACYNAGLNGRLECLQYLVEIVKCPYSYDVLAGLCHHNCRKYVETLNPRNNWWCCF